jgi:hypothetical protein
MRWTKPEAVEIKMDAEISSYQDDSYDPHKDGPAFVEGRVAPAETESERPTPRS